MNKVLLLLAVSLAATIQIALSSEQAPPTGDVEAIPDEATLLTMKVKQLKELLEKKGPDAACLACTSKQEYVDRIRQTADWPTLAAATPTAEMDPSMEDLRNMFQGNNDDEQMKNLRDKLRDSGVNVDNIFTANGLNKEGFEEELKRFSNSQPNTNTPNVATPDQAMDVDSHSEL